MHHHPQPTAVAAAAGLPPKKYVPPPQLPTSGSAVAAAASMASQGGVPAPSSAVAAYHPPPTAAAHHHPPPPPRARTAAPPPPQSSAAAAAAAAAAATSNTVSTLHPTTGQVENTGRWTAEEHRLFLQGLEQHGKGWKKIATLIKSRTVVQIRTHAQKYFQKLAKARQNGESVPGGVVVGGMGNVVGGAVVTTNTGMPGVAPTQQQLVSMGTVVVQASAARGAGAGGRGKRRNVAGGGGTKRRAIGNVVRSAVREGRNVKRQKVAETKRKGRANSTASAASAGTVASAVPAAAAAAAQQAPAAPPQPMTTQPTIVASAVSSETNPKEEYQVPNPLPAVSNVLDPYVTTTMGMPPPPAPASNAAAQQAKKKGRGRQQMVHTATHGTLPMAALEDAVFRLLTPATGVPSPPIQGTQQPLQPHPTNNAIVDPLAPASSKIAIAHTQYHPVPPSAPSSNGSYPQGLVPNHSPTCVADMSLLPSWVDAKNPPSWYNDGSDIDTLLEDADCLNWLSDTGDLDETYPAAMAEPAAV
ncbi:hypothetical protein ACHAXR_002390, partial [Thalassiosira sp. AJA248-18]